MSVFRGRARRRIRARGHSNASLRFPVARLLTVCAGVAGLALIAAVPASARPALARGFADPIFASPDLGVADLWAQRAVNAGAGVARVEVAWSSVASRQPDSPTDPLDPAYDFSYVDRGVRAANARGLRES